MSEKMVPEREAVIRERAAFERGYKTYRFVVNNQYEVGTMTGLRSDEVEALAKAIDREYPLEKAYRTVVGDNGAEYRFKDGKLEYQIMGKWFVSDSYKMETIKNLASLAENPFEAE